MTIPMTDLKAQYSLIKNEINNAIQRVIGQGQFILGSEVIAFEKEMAEYCGAKYAVGVASGTDALHLALLACGVKPGDEVITTPFTFIATAESIAHCGAVPVFADIDLKTYNINPREIEGKITSRTRAIIPVHLYGQPADMKPILQLAENYNLKVIEDCAQALGSEYNGKKAGSLADVGCLSFFPAKNLGAYGDGGMVVTNNAEIAEIIAIMRKHGSVETYNHIMDGFNSRLDALQAAILRAKLKYLDQWNQRRRDNGLLYNQLLGAIEDVITPPISDKGISSINYFTIRLLNGNKNRDELRTFLKAQGIATAIYYPLSLHLQKVYRHLGHKFGDFPNSEQAQEQVVSLPMYPELIQEQIELVVEGIKEFFLR